MIIIRHRRAVQPQGAGWSAVRTVSRKAALLWRAHLLLRIRRWPTGARRFAPPGSLVEQNGGGAAGAALAERGFSCAVETVCSEIETEDNALCEAAAEESPVPDSRFTVTIPADRISPDALARLRKLITSRHRLFCDALNATELPVEERDGKIAFPWFEQTDDEEEQAAYALFIERLAELSNRLKWAVSAEKDAPNEK